MPYKIVMKPEYKHQDPQSYSVNGTTHTVIELKDTKKLQLKALCDFAKELGWYLDGNCFMVHDWQDAKAQCISFTRMVNWYNTCFMCESHYTPYWRSGDGAIIYRNVSNKFDIPTSAMYNAVNSKLVKKVKLQMVKKSHEIIVVDHQVEID